MLTWSSLSYSQEDDDLEALYDRFEEEEVSKSRPQRNQQEKEKEDKGLSELSTLSPFSDIAVIQRKYLPKSGRFEFTAAAMGSINNAFFLNIGGAAKASYYFTTKWAVELNYFQLSSSERDVTQNLKARSVKTSSLVTPNSYYGGLVKWVPVYGKMALLNEKIVPFDIYFVAGAGVTNTDDDNPVTFTLGTGQIFAWTKSVAFRWDFVMNLYQPKVKSETSASGFKTQTQNDIFISAGVSFFFPEAKYR